MSCFKYRAYGIEIESEIEGDGMLPGYGRPDLRIRYGAVPDRLENPEAESRFFQLSHSEFLATVPDVARLWLRNGSEVTIEPVSGASEAVIRSYVFGSLFGLVLHQRGVLPLHGSAIATRSSAVVFSGPSGFGKSTIAAEFFRRGYPILSDDVCAIVSEHGIASIHPARASLFLLPDSLDKVGWDRCQVEAAPHSPDKYALPVALAFGDSALPVKAFYSLAPSDEEEIYLTRLSGFEKVRTLVGNVFKLELMNAKDAASKYFSQICELAESARVSVVRRPKGAFRLREMADALEEDFLS